MRGCIVTGLAAVAHLLNLPDTGDQELMKIASTAKHWLDANSGWLLVLDNVEDWGVIKEWLPSGRSGHVLITTRLQSTGAVAQGINLQSLTAEDGVTFLLRRANLDEASDSERSAAGEIAAEMGGLPLALELAAAFIEQSQVSLAEYLKVYKTSGASLRARTSEGSDRGTLSGTFALAFDKLTWPAKEILQTCAFLASDAIPEELLRHDDSSDLQFYEAIGELARISLVSRHSALKTIDIHRLVQDVVKDGMSDSQRRLRAGQVVGSLESQFPEAEFRNWPICERLLPHARAGIQLVREYGLDSTTSAQLMNRMANYLSARAYYAEAEDLLRHALDIFETLLGPAATATAGILNELAATLMIRGRHEEAEPLLARALAVYRVSLGDEHPQTANSLNNLATLYFRLGRLSEAEPLFRQALAIEETALGPDHPTVARSLSSLAALAAHTGRYDEAESLFRRALAIREKALGPSHPDVAMVLSSLGFLYYKQSRYLDALPLYQRSLAINQQALGPDHPGTIQIADNYVTLLRSLDREDDASVIEARFRRK